MINDFIKQSRDGIPFIKKQLIDMLNYSPNSPENYQIMAEAYRISNELTGNKAEIHAQFALNLAPCSKNCAFCSFASVNKIFSKASEIDAPEAIMRAKQFEYEGANAIYVMTTADFDFGKFLEISQEIKRNLKSGTILIANIGDKNFSGAKMLKDVGYHGVYHAPRLREGKDTSIDVKKRLESIRNFQEAGLVVGTCVEPVGPEHTNDELADMILLTGSFNPGYSGAARRITVPGSKLSQYGMISELRMSQIVAVTRLGMPRNVKGNCTHEPCTLGAIAGANLFWAEVGANPRDTKEKTEEGRGNTIEDCKNLFAETSWKVLKGPSVYYKSSNQG